MIVTRLEWLWNEMCGCVGNYYISEEELTRCEKVLAGAGIEEPLVVEKDFFEEIAILQKHYNYPFGEDCERLYAYVRASKDEELMVDCCKFNICSLAYWAHIPIDGHRDQDHKKAVHYIRKIQELAFQYIWGLSYDQLLSHHYFVTSDDGECRLADTGEIVARDGNPPQPHRVGFPQVLDTPRFHKYFERAVRAGFAERSDDGGVWLYGGDRGGKARLAYFAERAVCVKPTDRIAVSVIRALETFFRVVRLDRTIDQNADSGKSESVRKWREEIDEKIFFD